MNKYIDVEKLRAEIERRLREIPKKEEDKRLRAVYGGVEFELMGILDFIDSLQQEQPEVDLEMEIDDYTTEQYHKVFDGTGTLPEFDWVDVAFVVEDTARHFYELGLNARKEN